MPLTICLADSTEQREAVFRLRYTVLVEEARLPASLADHQFRCIEEPPDATARFVIARQEDTIVGALRINFPAEGDPENDAQWFQLHRVPEAHLHTTSITTPPLIAAGFRTSTLPLRLASMAYSMNLSEGITHDFVACAPDEEAFFHNLGYRAYCGRIRHPERGLVLPMVLALRDRTHLEQADSPLAAQLGEYRYDRPPNLTSS